MDILKTIIDIRNIESYKDKDKICKALIEDVKDKIESISELENKEMIFICEHLFWNSVKLKSENNEFYSQWISIFFNKYYKNCDDFFISNSNAKMLIEVAEVYDFLRMKDNVIELFNDIIFSKADSIFKLMAIEKFYSKYRFLKVEKLDEESLKGFLRLFLEAYYKNKDTIYLDLIDIVGERLTVVNDSSESYDTYLSDLLLSNQHNKLYRKSKALLEKNKYNNVALKYLTNFVLVAKGSMKYSEYEKYNKMKK